MNLRPGIILQARFASQRLPGKALEQIGNRTLLEHCLRRLIASGVERIVLATTAGQEDDGLAEIARRLGVATFRGSSTDVLGRFAAAADAHQLDPIIRATADNPAVDSAAANRLLRALESTGADYVHEVGLPVGAGLEAMTGAALHFAASEAASAHDREHVTTFIKSSPTTFRLQAMTAPRRLTAPTLRLTVDTPDDLAWVRQLFDHAGGSDPTVVDLIAAVRGVQREVA